MKIEVLRDEFEPGRGDMDDAGHRFLEAHGPMMAGHGDPRLQRWLTQHVEETSSQAWK